MDPKIVAKLHDAFKKALIEDPAVARATLGKYDMVVNYKSTDGLPRLVRRRTSTEQERS